MTSPHTHIDTDVQLGEAKRTNPLYWYLHHKCKSLMQKYGFNEDGQTTCECGDEQTMKHLLVCPILPQPCTHEDLEEFDPRARSCASIGREKKNNYPLGWEEVDDVNFSADESVLHSHKR